MMREIVLLRLRSLLVLLIVGLGATISCAGFEPATVTVHGVPVRCETAFVAMRDGVRLCTSVLTPTNVAPSPVVFVRTPYLKVRKGQRRDVTLARQVADYVARGYVYVEQQCRGTCSSEGTFRHYIEREDGLDTLAWIRRQPWYGGEIFPEGGSYLSSVHLAYLDTDPPDIKGAALSIQTDRMYYRNYRNGCCYGWCNFGWWKAMSPRKVRPDGAVPRRPYRDMARRAWGEDDPWFTDRLMHTDCDDFWMSDPRWNAMEHIRFPVLWRDGWWDFYIEGMTSMWERMIPEWKAKSVFEMSATAHGRIDFSQTSVPMSGAPSGLSTLDFFDAIRTGRTAADIPYGKMRYHSVGADDWRTGVWPRAVTYRFVPLAGTRADWTYDPHGPRIPGLEEGKCQRAWDPGSRTDAVEFVSAPFASDASFFGKPRLDVSVTSDCEDTQFFFRLDLVDPQGVAWNFCQTITSLRHAAPGYRPGTEAKVRLEFPLAGFTVRKGWSVRLDVCSDGGVYVQHANVARHWAEVTEDEVRVAHNAVRADSLKLEFPEEN